MTEQQQALPDQTPTHADYRRAAALMLHQYSGDQLGWNDTLAEADQLGRISALVLAVVEIAGTAPEPLKCPARIAGLRAVATGMALDEDPPQGGDRN